MTEREKVIKAFEFCLMPPSREELENDICSHEDCPYYREYNGGKCISAAASEALVLLKAQEQKPISANIVDSDGGLMHWWACGNCQAPINPEARFCHECGRAVKWDG